MKGIVVGFGLLCLFMAGCASTKQPVIAKPNRSASAHYSDIQNAINKKQLELADKRYLLLRGEHGDSELVPSAMVLLAKAHIAGEEYLLAHYYCDVYDAAYPTGEARETVAYLRIQSTFLRFRKSSSDPKLAERLYREIRAYSVAFTQGNYTSKVKTIIKQYREIQQERNEKIALQYEKRGKTEAAAYYRSKKREL